MKLTCQNWRDQIDPAILERGYDYWSKGKIFELSETDGGHKAIVAGTDNYEIEVIKKDDELLTICDCPYDLGPICKHEVAVLLAVENGLKDFTPRKRRVEGTVSREPKRPVTPTTKISLRKSINDLSEFSYIDLIRNDVRRATRHGFIDWDQAWQAAENAYGLLDEAEEIASNDASKAIEICLAIIKGLTPTLKKSDDSDGEIGGAIDGAFDLMIKISQNLPSAELCEECLKNATIQQNIDWGFDKDWLHAAINFAPEQNLADPVLSSIRKLRTSHNFDYAADQLEADWLTKWQPDQLEKYLRGHLDNLSLMQRLITLKLDDGDLAEAKNLLAEMLGKINGPYHEWALDKKLWIAEQEKDLPAQTAVLHELILTSSDKYCLYFSQYKKLVSEKQWRETLQKLAKINVYHSAGIYQNEQMWDESMELIEQTKNVWLLNNVYQILARQFPERVAQAYIKIVENNLASTSNRDFYAEQVRYLRRAKKLGLHEETEALANELITTHPNRRAMVEELRKL